MLSSCACNRVLYHARSFSNTAFLPALLFCAHAVPQLRSAASDALVTLCEHHGPNFVVLRMCNHAKSHRSPKVHAETCNVIANILNGFAMQLSAKAVVAFARAMLVR